MYLRRPSFIGMLICMTLYNLKPMSVFKIACYGTFEYYFSKKFLKILALQAKILYFLQRIFFKQNI